MPKLTLETNSLATITPVGPVRTLAEKVAFIAQANVGQLWHGEACTQFVYAITTAAGARFFDSTDYTPANNRLAVVTKEVLVPHSPAISTTGPDALGDKWEHVPLPSRFGNTLDIGELSEHLRVGDVVRAYDLSASKNEAVGHSFIVTGRTVLPNGTISIRVVDNVDGIKGNSETTNRISEHDLDWIRPYLKSTSAVFVSRISGNWSLDGTSANNTTIGGGGDDLISGSAGADYLDGAAGRDTVTYQLSTKAVTIDLKAGVGKGGDAEGDTLRGIENVTGSKNGDTLSGNDLGNVLRGGGGADILTGNGGKDTFVISDAGDSKPGAPDVVTDFVRGTDKIDLSALDANPSKPGNQDFTWIGTKSFSANGIPEVAFHKGVLEIDIGGDGTVDVAVSLLGLRSMNASDVLGLI